MRIQFLKRYINTFALEELDAKLRKQNAQEERLLKSAPLLILYNTLTISPLKVTIEANPRSLTRLVQFLGLNDLRKTSGKFKDLPSSDAGTLSSHNLKFLPGSVGADSEVCFEPQSEDDIKDIIQDVLISLHQLHSVAGLVHGGISRDCLRIVMTNRASDGPEKPRPRAVLTDCACAQTLFVERSRPWKVASRLAAPEILARQPYGFPADVFGVGALVLELVNIMLQDRKSEVVSHKLPCTENLAGGGLAMDEMQHLSPRAQSFVMPCLRSDPETRPSILQLLMHPFIDLPSNGAGASNVNTAPLGLPEMPPRSVSALRHHADPRLEVEDDDDDEEEDEEELEESDEEEDEEESEDAESDSD